MGDQQAQVLRRRLSRYGGGRRYPPELRQEVVAWARTRRSAGVSWHALSAELGMGMQTVQRWTEVAGWYEGGVVAVEVVGSLGLRVVSPAGYRVEGLSLAEVAQLLRELS